MAVTSPQITRPRRSGRGRLLDLHAVAEELGVSFDSIDRILRAGSLPFVRLPTAKGHGPRRVDRADLDRFIADHKQFVADDKAGR